MRADRRRQRSTVSGSITSLLAMAALGCVIAGGCAGILGIEDDVEVIEPSGPGSGGSGAGTPGAGASSSSGGGTGGGAACTAPGECPGAELPCSVRTCLGGVCGLEDKPPGTVAPEQKAGDCKRNDCDGAGNVIVVIDGNDPEDDGEDCTIDSCREGEPVHLNAFEGSPCGNGQSCNGQGQCSCTGSDDPCGESTTCQTKACVDNVCVTTNERDGLSCDTCRQCAQGQCVPVFDGSDPFGDCGTCVSCQAGACVNVPAGQPDPVSSCPGQFSQCNGNGQCECDDNMQNGMETGVDCGFYCSSPCAEGSGCMFGADCATKCCNTQQKCGTCGVDCTCTAPDLVCKVGGTCGD